MRPYCPREKTLNPFDHPPQSWPWSQGFRRFSVSAPSRVHPIPQIVCQQKNPKI